MVVVRARSTRSTSIGSPNLKDWTHLSEFGPTGAVGGAWECPDLFPLAVNGNPRNIKWVMVVNLNPGGIAGGSGGQYFVGDFDGTTFTSDDPPTYTPPSGTVLEDFEGTSFAPWTTAGTRSVTAPPPATLLGKAASPATSGIDWPTASTAATQPRNPDLTGVPGQRRLPQLPGRRRQPSARCRDHAGSQPASGTVFADFEGDTWGTGWTATGDFEDDGPRPGTIGDQQAVSGYQGERLVNTFTDHDLATGTITSPSFTINQNYINLLVGGGNHPYTGSGADATSVNLVVDGQVVRTATGQDSELANWVSWDVDDLAGQAGPDPDRGQQHRRLGPHPGRPHHVLRRAGHPRVDRNHGEPPGRRAGCPHRHGAEQRDAGLGGLGCPRPRRRDRPHSDHRQQHQRLGPHPGRPVHLRRRACPVGDPTGALARLRPRLLRRCHLQQHPAEQADHDRLDEQLAVRQLHPHRPVAKRHERFPGN